MQNSVPNEHSIRERRSIFYAAIVKERWSSTISLSSLVLHATQLKTSIAFYSGYIKSGFFSGYICIYNARTNPKEMNTGDRYPAAYWWTPGIRWAMRGFAPCHESLYSRGSHFPRWRKIFPHATESKQFSRSRDGNTIPTTSRKNGLTLFRWIMRHPFSLDLPPRPRGGTA